MKNFVITINRGFGSGGRTIGKYVAEQLGINFYDMDLIKMSSLESGVNEALFAQTDEKLKANAFFKLIRNEYKGNVLPPTDDKFVSEKNLFNLQAKMLRNLAEHESFVVIGRCSDYILQDYDNVISLYIDAPRAACVKEVMDRYSKTEKEAIKIIKKMDKNRRDYYTYYTGREMRNPIHYDMFLNSDKLGYDNCVAMIKAYVALKFGDVKK